MELIRTVSALLFWLNADNGTVEVLLHRHKKSGKFMGFGGKVDIDNNETENAALVREYYEESGIIIHNTLIGQLDYQRLRYKAPDSIVEIYLDNGYQMYLDHTYYIQACKTQREQEIIIEDGIHEYGWFDIRWAIDNLEMFEDTKQQLREILNEHELDTQGYVGVGAT